MGSIHQILLRNDEAGPTIRPTLPRFLEQETDMETVRRYRLAFLSVVLGTAAQALPAQAAEPVINPAGDLRK
jgi:hypothetical protein